MRQPAILRYVLIIDSTANLSTIIDADVVIAGAGTVGLFVAQYLLRQGLRVAVIESGDRVAAASNDGQGAQAIGKAHSGVHLGRAFGLGGTSTLWGGQLVEFQPEDLQRPESTWPISYAELKTLYAAVYQQLGLAPRADDAVWREQLGVEIPAGTLEHFYTTWLAQPNFSVLWGKLLQESDQLRVYLKQVAVAAQFEGSRCVAIDARDAEGRVTRFEGRCFLLALGTIGNVQFCLTQTLAAATPWRTDAGIGAWFQDHLFGKVGELQLKDERRFRRWFENCFAGGHKLQPKLRFSKRSDSPDGLGICGFFGFRSLQNGRIDEAKQLIRTLRNGVYHAKLWRLPLELLRVGSTLAPIAYRFLAARRVLATFDAGVDFLVQAEQLPIAQSAIRAQGNRRTRAGLLEVGVDWQICGREAATIRAFFEQAQHFFVAQGIGQIEPAPILLGDDQALLDGLSDTYHQCGGLRMSDSPEHGVTNADGRIWSTENVHVLGAALLPSSSFANCTLTALAMALKAARAAEAGLRP